MERLAVVRTGTQDEGAADAAIDSVEVARDRVNSALAEGCSQKTIAREVGISASALSQFQTGNYAGDSATVAAKVLKWHTTREAALSIELRRQSRSQFVLTSTSRRMLSALAYAQRSGRLVEMIGPPGVGKTSAIREHERRNPNVWPITASITTAAPNAILDAMCAKIGLDIRITNGGARGMQIAIEKRLRGTRGLVIVDESQFLSFAALETCRALADATEIGFAFVGSYALSIKVGGRRAIGTTAQFVSRLAMRVKIEGPHASDAPALLDEWQIDDAESRSALLPLAERPGALRNLAMVIELATVAASVADEKLSAKHFKSALKELEE